MKSFLVVLLGVAFLFHAGLCAIGTTDQRIASYNYPVETHTVQTSDGCILTLFRIPFSPKLQNQHEYRPVIFLQHGILSSSDNWILNGPNDALAYVLVDAGYDVWLGNARGNFYSRKNVYKSPRLRSFWDFSWHEIAVIDLPAMIDYVLDHTNQTALHFVGHSQGTTVYFVCLSELPSYNKKIKSGHMLAPIVFMGHLEGPITRALGPLLGHPSPLSDVIASRELLPATELLEELGGELCTDSSVFQPLCSTVIFLFTGFDYENLNTTLLPNVYDTYPAGSSSTQGIHYLQELESGNFEQFNHGVAKNFVKYGQASPPKYKLENVVAATHLYYCDNDWFASVVDVQKLAGLLPNVTESFNVPIPKCNHIDFMFALFVKDVLYVRIIDAVNRYEQIEKQRR